MKKKEKSFTDHYLKIFSENRNKSNNLPKRLVRKSLYFAFIFIENTAHLKNKNNYRYDSLNICFLLSFKDPGVIQVASLVS